MDNGTKRDIILEHYSHPINKEKVYDNNYVKINTKNPNCIDNVDLYILFEDDKIKDIKFDGEACAVSTSSTSIMIKNLIGKSLDEAEDFINNFYNMIYEDSYDTEVLQDGIVFDEIYKQNNRKNCVLLPYRGITKAIDDYKSKK